MGLPVTVSAYTHAEREKFDKRLKEINTLKKAHKDDKDVMPDVKPLKKATEWQVFESQFLQELGRHRNVITYVPLTYVVQKWFDANDADDGIPTLRGCASVKEALYYYCKLDPVDDARVWEIIYTYTFEGDLYRFIDK